MKTIKFLVMGFLGACLCLFTACSSDSDETIPDPEPVPPVITQPDELEFKVLVYIDKPSVMGHLGGSERTVKPRLNTLFRQVSNFWNDSSKGKLKYKYKYTLADMIVYEGASNDATLRKKIYNDPMDFSKYDVTVLFDCLQDNGETGNGGAAHGGGSDNRSVVTVIANSGNKKEIFTDDTFKTLAHELGHYRGVTDMYQYLIDAKDNPVSHESFDVPPCIMKWTSDGVWSEYAVNCMNLSAGAKQIGKVFPDFFNNLYPKKIEINVTVSGKPEKGVTVKLYGSRAGATGRNRDIYSEVFVEGKTDSNGQYVLNDAKKYFNPKANGFANVPADLPYGRWFGFLAEIISGNLKKYVWMPEWAVQMPSFEGKDTYKVEVAL